MSPVTAEDEFLVALTTVRATYGPASINETDLKEIVATEESRVADAAVLAELITTRITVQQAQPTARPPAPSHSSEGAGPSRPTPIPFPVTSSAAPFSIADLIDGMIAQEKRDVRKPTQS